MVTGQQNAAEGKQGICVMWSGPDPSLSYDWVLPDGSLGTQSWLKKANAFPDGAFTEVTMEGGNPQKRYYLKFQANSNFTAWVEELPQNSPYRHALYLTTGNRDTPFELLHLQPGPQAGPFWIGYGRFTGEAPLQKFVPGKQAYRLQTGIALTFFYERRNGPLVRIMPQQENSLLGSPISFPDKRGQGQELPSRSFVMPTFQAAAVVQAPVNTWKNMTLVCRWMDERGVRQVQTWQIGDKEVPEYREKSYEWEQELDIQGWTRVESQTGGQTHPYRYGVRLTFMGNDIPFEAMLLYEYQKNWLGRYPLDSITLQLKAPFAEGKDTGRQAEFWVLPKAARPDLELSWRRREKPFGDATWQKNIPLQDQERTIRFRLPAGETGCLCADAFEGSMEFVASREQPAAESTRRRPYSPSSNPGPAVWRLQIPRELEYKLLRTTPDQAGADDEACVLQKKQGNYIQGNDNRYPGKTDYKCRVFLSQDFSGDELEICREQSEETPAPLWLIFRQELPYALQGSMTGVWGEVRNVSLPAGTRYVEIRASGKEQGGMEVQSMAQQEWDRQQGRAFSFPWTAACRMTLPPGMDFEILYEKTDRTGKKTRVSAFKSQEVGSSFAYTISTAVSKAYECRGGQRSYSAPYELEVRQLPGYYGTMAVWVALQQAVTEPLYCTVIDGTGEETTITMPHRTRYVEIRGAKRKTDPMTVRGLIQAQWANAEEYKTPSQSAKQTFNNDDWAADLERYARWEAEEKARREAEEKARREAEEKARREAEEKARREAEEKARREAEEKARRDAEEKARREAEEKARREAEEKARREAEEKARQEAEEKARREAEEKARQEAEEKARRKQAEEAALNDLRAQLEQRKQERQKKQALVKKQEEEIQQVSRQHKELQEQRKAVGDRLAALHKDQADLQQQAEQATRQEAALRAALRECKALAQKELTWLLENPCRREGTRQAMDRRIQGLVNAQIEWEDRLTELQQRVTGAVDSRTNDLNGRNT